MLKSIRKSGLAAMAGLVNCVPRAIRLRRLSRSMGAATATVAGWKITPDVGVTVEADGSSGSLDITKTADFSSNSPLGISFVQIRSFGR